MNLYKGIFRPLAFSLDSESVHKLALKFGPLARQSAFKSALSATFHYEDRRLEVDCAGLRFKNPVGLAAGFDKDCDCPELLSSFGFSHIELGTVTAEPQPGNPRPRIFRLPEDKSLINRMGFPSNGSKYFAHKLAKVKRDSLACILGVNIGKTKATPLDNALGDYLSTMGCVHELADYFTINVSSPNTPELRKLQEPARLRELISGLNEKNTGAKPLFLKIAPDLSWDELDALLEICVSEGISGIIATNTTFSREGLISNVDEQGGLSGPLLLDKSCAIVRHITDRTQNELPVIGVGGISNTEDAIRFFKAGASLVQVYTGLIYEGPSIVSRINKGLVRFMQENGLSKLSELRE